MGKIVKKTKELVRKFQKNKVYVAIKQRSGAYKEYYTYMSLESAKQCALICQNEILKALQSIPDLKVSGNILLDKIEEHQKVKQEIEK